MPRASVSTSEVSHAEFSLARRNGFPKSSRISAQMTTDTSGPYPRLVVPGIDEAVARAADELALFSELDLPWARRAAAVNHG